MIEIDEATKYNNFNEFLNSLRLAERFNGCLINISGYSNDSGLVRTSIMLNDCESVPKFIIDDIDSDTLMAMLEVFTIKYCANVDDNAYNDRTIVVAKMDNKDNSIMRVSLPHGILSCEDLQKLLTLSEPQPKYFFSTLVARKTSNKKYYEMYQNGKLDNFFNTLYENSSIKNDRHK